MVKGVSPERQKQLNKQGKFADAVSANLIQIERDSDDKKLILRSRRVAAGLEKPKKIGEVT